MLRNKAVPQQESGKFEDSTVRLSWLESRENIKRVNKGSHSGNGKERRFKKLLRPGFNM